MPAPSVFISYAHADRVQKDEIVKHLRALNYHFELIPWSDDEIQVGDDYREQIDAALTAASVSILLVSVDALTSRFIKQSELPRLLHRRQTEGMLLIPVLVRPCPWKQIEWLEALQLETATPLSELTEPEREQRCVRLAERVLQHLVRLADWPTPSKPDEVVAGQPEASRAPLPRADPFHVDRKGELQAFLTLFDPSTNDQVMVVSAKPSMGKTWFVRTCVAFKPAGSALAMVDFKELGYGVPDIIQHIADSFDFGGRFPNLTEQLRAQAERPPSLGLNPAGGPTPLERHLTKVLVEEARVNRMPGSFDLIVFDSLEAAPAPVRVWVSNVLIGWVIKDKGLVLVIAGKDITDVGKSHPAGVIYRELAKLALADAAELATAYGLELTSKELEDYYDFTAGNPLALASGFQNLRAGRPSAGIQDSQS